VRKFVASVGPDNVENWFTLRKADALSYPGYLKYKKDRISPFYKVVQEYLNKLPKEDHPSFPQAEPNINLGGKDSQARDASLSVKGNE